MKRHFLFIAGLLFSMQVMAQTGIGTTTPHASAKLDVSATDKGFLPPRVALTSTNLASPINSPANGLMVFNTASAGASPFNVVPGYYYWDGIGQQWVSISTTVGNVQNQAIFRSTSNTSAGSVITSWNARFNNISSVDLAIYSLTEFTLSNGIYKIEWALPFQSSNTYNTMVLQEFSSGSWGTFRGDAAYASLSNGGNTDWGGGTFAADILDCSSASKTIRIINNDGASRILFKGVTLIITKLNPSITTSTTADNLGNHIATANIQLNNNYLSNDGSSTGIRIDNIGNVGIGATSSTVAGIGPGKLDITGIGDFTLKLKGDDYVGFGVQSFRSNSSDHALINLFGARGTMSSPSTILSGDNISTISSRAYTGSEYTPITNIQSYYTGTNQGTITFSTNGGSSTTTERMRINHGGNVGIGTSSPNYTLHVKSSNPTSVYLESTTVDNNGLLILNANTNQYWANNYHEFVFFQNQGTNIGGVYGTNGGNQVSYNTSSDYRLKKDLKDFDGLKLVNKIKVYDFAWKSTGDRMYGVMAHELQDVLQYAVSGNKDELNSNGTPKIQSVDYSKLTPILIKAIQEQELKIKEQQKQIDLLIKRLEIIEKQ